MKTVFQFICCNRDLCSPCGVHYRTRNSGFHFEVWKPQGRNFNGKDHDVQEYFAGQEVRDSGTEFILKRVQNLSLMDATVQLLLSGLRTGPRGLSSPLHKVFYTYMQKVYSVIKTTRISTYLKTCPTSAKIGFMQMSQCFMSK